MRDFAENDKGDDTLGYAGTVFGLQPAYLRRHDSHYCATYEEALRRAKAAGKAPGCNYGGITLPSGKKAFAIYREGKVIERYSAMNITLERKNFREV